MYRFPPFGDRSQGPERAAEFNDSYLVEHLAAQVKRALSQQGVLGGLIRKASQGSRNLVEKAMDLISKESFITRVSCSEFSQALNFGALLFLLADAPDIEFENDSKVLFAVKNYFLALSDNKASLVLVDHAHLLDLRSEWLLSRLASMGVIRIILRTERPDELGPTFSELLHQQLLVNIRCFHMNRTIFDDFLAQRLSDKISAQARTHYLVSSENDLSILARVVEMDLASNVLRNEHGTWILDISNRIPARYSRTYDSLSIQTSSHGRDLLRRLELNEGVPSTEILNDLDAQAMMRRLFADGLVENSGTGLVRLKDHQKKILSPNLNTPVRGTRERYLVGATKAVSAREYDNEYNDRRSDNGKDLNLAKYTELMAFGDLDGTRDLLDKIKMSLSYPAESSELASTEYTIFNWYLEMRSGGWPEIWHSDTSDAGITACIYDERWRDASNQLLGVLLTAYCWTLEGKLTPASKLLRWAIEAFRNSDSYLRDGSFRLWYPHIAFLSYIVAFNLCQWRVMDTVDEMVTTDAHQDLTAAGIKEFFSALRNLTHGRAEASKKALTTVMAQGVALSHSSDRGVQRDVAALLDVMADWQPDEHFSLKSDGEIPVPSRATHWSHAYLRLLRRAYVLPVEQVARDAQDYVAACLSAGHFFSACMAVSVSLNIGSTIDRKTMHKIVDGTNDDFARTLQHLNEALTNNDLDSAVDTYCQMASTGMYFCVDLPMKRLEIFNLIQRRKLQRTLASVKGIKDSRSVSRATGKEEPATWTQWHSTLTKRERSIATMAAQGLHNSELAEHFGISIRTVEGHLYRTLEKLELRNRRELSALISSQERAE